MEDVSLHVRVSGSEAVCCVYVCVCHGFLFAFLFSVGAAIEQIVGRNGKQSDERRDTHFFAAFSLAILSRFQIAGGRQDSGQGGQEAGESLRGQV